MKFVVHHHMTEKEHYDFMIEQAESLLTFRITVPDLELLLRGRAIEAEKINDHRKEYLTYEGPVSCDRGRVDIYDSGEYRTVLWNNNEMEIILDGDIFKGSLKINHAGGPFYQFIFNYAGTLNLQKESPLNPPKGDFK